MKKEHTLQDLVDIISKLRGEGGCDWDRAQTHKSLRGAMLEEAYEAADAIDKAEPKNLCEELGDVLLQVVFHAQIAQEEGEFTIEDVLEGICSKMIYRHPHVFGSEEKVSEEALLDRWYELKKKEKNYQTVGEEMQACAAALPALNRAEKLQTIAEKWGDAPQSIPIWVDRITKNLELLKMENIEKNRGIEGAIGEILFSTVALSRKFAINAEFSLTKAVEQFINRSEYIARSSIEGGLSSSLDANLEKGFTMQ